MTLNVVSIVLCLLSLLPFSYAQTYGWGQNDRGQLGLGHMNTVFYPTSIPFYATIPLFDVLTAPTYHIALANNGRGYASGMQAYGQWALGSVNPNPVTSPVLCPTINKTMDVTCAGTFCNANMNTNLYGWGNIAGYVQAKTTGTAARIQEALRSYRFDGKVLSVSSALEAVIVRCANSTVWAAGINVNGRLGLGNNSTVYSFKEVLFWRDVPLKQVFSGQSAHACAVAVNGSLYCWGLNSYGQLGLGDSTERRVPTKVSFFEDNGHEIYKVSYGEAFTMVLTCGGRLFGFGANGYSQLGTVQNNSVHTPIEIKHNAWNKDVVDVVTGISQTFVRLETGAWYIWGGGGSGSLGTGNKDNVIEPKFSYNITNLGINRIRTSSQSASVFGWYDQSVSNARLGCPVMEDECISGNHNCSVNASCIDLERGYRCFCREGYEGDGYIYGTGCIKPEPEPLYSCETLGYQCVEEAMCDDSSGDQKIECICPPGYLGDGRYDGNGCYDFDECEGDPCAANAYCTNTEGNYNCTCNDGFHGDPFYDGCIVMCKPGQYGYNATSCSSCPAGTYTNDSGATTCKPCSAGYYNPDSGSSSYDACKKCPTGGYSGWGATYCSLCESGYTNDPGQVHVDNSTCTSCPLGQYGYYGVCYDCDSGEYSIDAVAKQCRNCPPGSSSNQSRSLSCDKCPAGYNSRGGLSRCTTCPAGFYSTEGSKDCLRCPPGTSTNGLTGQSSCSNCTAGYFSSKYGAQNCLECPAGTYSSAFASSCSRCPQGTYTGTQASRACTKCTNGTYAPSTASTVCRQCESGSVTTDGINCVPCTAGTYLDSTKSSCKPCAAGTFVAVTGASSCFACAPGTYASGTGATYCKRCDLNTYTNNTTGYTACTPCPTSTSSPGGASTCS